jgi:hypothetical protein
MASAVLLETGDKILQEDATLVLRNLDPIGLALSPNIAASAATATTALLIPPAGRTVSDFVAGRISDDTNPLPSLTIAQNKYTEIEWCLQASEDALVGDTYEFRITRGGIVLDTYSNIPKWTIGVEIGLGGLLLNYHR